MAASRLSVYKIPALMAALRLEMAKFLRAEAEGQSPEVVAKLTELAAVFETGATGPKTREWRQRRG